MHLMAGSAQGGAEGFCLRLVLALQRRGIAQMLVTRPDMARLDELRAAGVKVVTSRFATPLLDFKTNSVIQDSFRQFMPDIVLSWMNRANAFATKLKGKEAKLVGRLGGYYDLKYYRSADYLIGNTEDLVDYFTAQGWPTDRSIYLPNFAEFKSAAPLPRAVFTTPDDAPLFLALGRFHENKAFDTLLNAFAQVPPASAGASSAYLWLAGDGDLRGELEAQAKSLGISGRVRFLGWHSDPAALYATADYFVCPSRHEPLGNVILEGLANGLPVISTDNNGARQLLQNNITGRVVPVDDAPALAAAMREFIADPAGAAQIAQAGQNFYQENYSEEIVCDRYIDFFNHILGRN